MNFEEVKNLIKSMDITSIKVIDVAGNKIITYEKELSPENLLAKIEGFLPTLQTFGRVTFIAATYAQLKQNWKDCYKWTVIFNSAASVASNTEIASKQPQGYVSALEAQLMRELESLKQERDFDKKIAALEKKMDEGKEKTSETERMFDKYFPFVAPQLGIEFDFDKMMKMAQLKAMMEGKVLPMGQPGIAGTNQNQNTQPTMQQTEEEQKVLQGIIDGMEKLSEKVSADKILTAVTALNDNPQMFDMLITFINQNKNTNGKTT